MKRDNHSLCKILPGNKRIMKHNTVCGSHFGLKQALTLPFFLKTGTQTLFLYQKEKERYIKRGKRKTVRVKVKVVKNIGPLRT